jgi:phosphopantothenoylcysteine decarboxylase/phosphopantothenate--cysteine ligase
MLAPYYRSYALAMLQLNNKQILLAVTGGIAAYKSAELIRRLKDVGAEVRVVMTQGAQEFITPLTLQALSANPVHTALLDPAAEAGMGHIELARWADLVLVAPATADFMARLAQGRADDLLTTLCLATDAPIAIAPAMNQGMWKDATTQTNLAILQNKGVLIFGPGEGSQACGDIGPGRMLEPEQLAAMAAGQFQSRALDGISVVITAGPTREAIDPVRYISNHSSGKMGFAIAEAAAEAGARVTLIAGPVSLATPEHVRRVDVESAEQMYTAAIDALKSCDIFIASAAVADYRPVTIAEQKIKKNDQSMQIALTRNPDIVAAVAAHSDRPYTVGFAAETEKLLENGRNKLVKKQLDLVIANDVSVKGVGFNSDDNAVTLIGPDGDKALPLASKRQLGRMLIATIAEQFHAK